MESRRRAASGVVVTGTAAGNSDLLRRCLGGDQEAWSALVDKYERLVYAIPLREGCGEELARDITQETFSQLLRSLKSITEPDSLAQWLATVCRREVWRRRTADGFNELELVEEQLDPAPDFVDGYVHSAEVYEAVQALPNPCRSLIFGLFFDPTEPDYATLAVQLGRPVGSIGPLRGRCLGQLKTIMSDRAAS
jgi:RNA polymerase sigma factor (sigma-70 family)